MIRSIIRDECDLLALRSQGLPPVRFRILDNLTPASAAELMERGGVPNMLEGRPLTLRTDGAKKLEEE